MVGRCWDIEMETRDQAVIFADVRKKYPGGAEALRGLSFSVRKGEIFCLVGPNGSGKTTSLRILGTQLAPSSGEVRVLGIDAVKYPKLVRPHLGVVPQDAQPAYELRTFEQIYFYLRARGMSRREARQAADDAVRTVGMSEFRNVVAGKLSGGYRRRILIALAIATGAEVLLLDEPTTGLDPVARRQVWQDLVRLKANHAVLLTTHSMEESEALADSVGIVHQGRMVACGSVAQLRKMLKVEFKVRIEDGTHRDALQRFGVIEEYGGKFVLYPSNPQAIDDVVRFAVHERLPVSVLPVSLEDVYFHVIRETS